MPAPASISELTVTCNQCGSASLERLDRKEYRCNHCGAITLISDNDADRIEALLRDALARQSRYASYPVNHGATVPSSMTATQTRRLLAVLAGIVGISIASLIVLGRSGTPRTYQGNSGVTIGRNGNIGGGAYGTYVPPKDIPFNQVTLSPPVWIGDKDGIIPTGAYNALLYNHSGSTIDVPDYEMTFFPNGLKGGTAMFHHDASHLLPGEYTRVSFSTMDTKNVNARYEIEPPRWIRESTVKLARVPLEQPQLVREPGRYRFIGLLRNTLNRPLSYSIVSVILYGPDHQLLGGESGGVSALRPGEKAAVDVDISVPANAPPVRSYDYLVDTSLEQRP